MLWECPSCRRPTTVTDADRRQGQVVFNTPHPGGEGWAAGLKIDLDYVLCPNPRCRKPRLDVVIEQVLTPTSTSGPLILQRRLLPTSSARVFPEYVPKPIRQDYEEACDILDRSPKASATLSRRCLQGMIRDFHGVVKDSLKKEIDALEATIDKATWESLDAVRQIGNIGAHMEKDINVIVDVEPDEARLLITLVESLVDAWYVVRHDAQERNEALAAAAARVRNEG